MGNHHKKSPYLEFNCPTENLSLPKTYIERTIDSITTRDDGTIDVMFVGLGYSSACLRVDHFCFDELAPMLTPGSSHVFEFYKDQIDGILAPAEYIVSGEVIDSEFLESGLFNLKFSSPPTINAVHIHDVRVTVDPMWYRSQSYCIGDVRIRCRLDSTGLILLEI